MSKINIVIVDDVPGHVKLIEESFVEKTFLKKVSQVHTLNYLKAHNGNGDSLESFLKEKGDIIDLLLLDLSFIDEGYEGEHDVVVNLVIGWMKAQRLDFSIVLVSNDGADSPHGLIIKNGYEFPFLRKDAKPRTIDFVLAKVFDKWIQKNLLKLKQGEISKLKRNILNDYSGSLDIGQRSYSVKNFFAIDNNDYQASFKRTTTIPDFDFPGWSELNPNMKFESPIKDYFTELQANNFWSEKLEDLCQYLTAFLQQRIFTYLDDQQKQEIEDLDKIELLASNIKLKWDTSTLPSMSHIELAMDGFIRRLVERRLILFLYLICEESTDEIYFTLKGRHTTPGEKVIGNGFRYSYFLFKTTDKSDLELRQSTYHDILDQMTREDKIYVVETGMIIYNLIKGFDQDEIPISLQRINMVEKSIRK